jgi:hypothetical protein
MFHSRPARKLRAYRPRLELLESRALLSTYLVDHLADDLVGTGTSGSLRYCLTQAADGDHITFGVTGKINLTGALPDLTHSISIEGPGASLMTVRRDTGGNYRIFTVAGATTVSISGLTITNGLVIEDRAAGGGIDNAGTLTVSNCTISGNIALGAIGYSRAGYGGGIANFGTLTLSNSTVAGNDARGEGDACGGGISNDGGTVTVNNSTISGNTALWQSFDDNGGRGGGIYNVGGTFTLSNTTFAGNHADGFYGGGGGIYNDDYGTVTLNNATVSGNSAIYAGGGILNSDYGTVTLNNATVSGNSVYNGDGGGIVNYGALTLNNATVSSNTFYPGGGHGAGIANYGTLHARNTIIAGNTPSDLVGNLGSLGHNLIGNTNGGSGFDDTDLLNVNPLLGPLQDNGGPTQTMALLAGSSALNAGDPTQLGMADQRGVARSGGVNIGAYQASATAFVLAAPDTVQAGAPFDVTVTAVDPYGQVALGYTGTVTFSTSDPDPSVVLPAVYTSTADDQGTHTFSSAFVLLTPGPQTLTADDPDGGFCAGAVVTVQGAGPAPHRHRGGDSVDALFAVLDAEWSGHGHESGAPAWWGDWTTAS